MILGPIVACWSLQSHIALVAGGVVYGIVLLWLRPLTAEKGHVAARRAFTTIRLLKVLVGNDPGG